MELCSTAGPILMTKGLDDDDDDNYKMTSQDSIINFFMLLQSL